MVIWGGACEGFGGALFHTGSECVYSNHGAFAVVLDDGFVKTWGISDCGGHMTAGIRRRLTNETARVEEIFCTADAFAE